jgi:hypothetical protein
MAGNGGCMAMDGATAALTMRGGHTAGGSYCSRLLQSTAAPTPGDTQRNGSSRIDHVHHEWFSLPNTCLRPTPRASPRRQSASLSLSSSLSASAGSPSPSPPGPLSGLPIEGGRPGSSAPLPRSSSSASVVALLLDGDVVRHVVLPPEVCRHPGARLVHVLLHLP